MRIASAIVWLAGAAALAGGCAGTVSPEGKKLLLAANSAYQSGDDAAAAQAASRFLQMHPQAEEAGEAHYIRGMSELRQGQEAAGRADLLSALRFAKRKDLIALAHAKLGELAYDAGNMAQAETQYRAVLPNTPAGAPPADEAMYRLGCILQRQGRWGEADRFFDKVIHLFDGTELAKRSAIRIRATHWSVQVGAFATPAPAEELRARLARTGLPARIDLELREGQMLRLVRVGSYRTYSQAEAELPKVQAIRRDAFVTAAR